MMNTTEFYKLKIDNNLKCTQLETNTCILDVLGRSHLQLDAFTLQANPTQNYNLVLPSELGSNDQVFISGGDGMPATWETYVPPQGAVDLDALVETSARQLLHLTSTQSITGPKTFSNPVLPEINVLGGTLTSTLTYTYDVETIKHIGSVATLGVYNNKYIQFDSSIPDVIQINFCSSDTNVANYHARIEFSNGTATNGAGTMTVYAKSLDMNKLQAGTVFIQYVSNVQKTLTSVNTDFTPLVGVTPGVALPEKFLVMDASKNISGINQLTSTSIQAEQLIETGIVTWSGGSQTINPLNAVYIADCRSAPCTLILTPGNTNFTNTQYRVIRYADTETYPLILDAATNGATLQLLPSTNLSITTIMEQFGLYDDGSFGYKIIYNYNI